MGVLGIEVWLPFAPAYVCVCLSSPPVDACWPEVSVWLRACSMDGLWLMHQTTWHVLFVFSMRYIMCDFCLLDRSLGRCKVIL